MAPPPEEWPGHRTHRWTSSRPPRSSVSPDTPLALFKKLPDVSSPPREIKEGKIPDQGGLGPAALPLISQHANGSYWQFASARRPQLRRCSSSLRPDGGGGGVTSSDRRVELRRRNFSQFSNSSNLPLRSGTPKFSFLHHHVRRQRGLTFVLWGGGGGDLVYMQSSGQMTVFRHT